MTKTYHFKKCKPEKEEHLFKSTETKKKRGKVLLT